VTSENEVKNFEKLKIILRATSEYHVLVDISNVTNQNELYDISLLYMTFELALYKKKTCVTFYIEKGRLLNYKPALNIVFTKKFSYIYLIINSFEDN